MSTSGRSQKDIRTGSVSVSISDLSKDITFSTPLPSSSYRVILQVEGSLVVTLWPTSKTTTGFTLNLSVGVSGTISYVAVSD